MSWLTDASDFMVAGLEAISESATFTHGGTSTAIEVAVGSTLFRADDAYGVTIRTRSTDFITTTEISDPVAGDTVTYEGKTFEVLAPNGEPVWRWADRALKIRRIHTKEVS